MPDSQLYLGTAMWGWTIDRPTAFALLDTFYAAGFRDVDTATNYPIDKNPDHWRLAETWLAEWIGQRGIEDLRVMVKVGSINNLQTPDHRLSRSFLLMQCAAYQRLFGPCLDTLMIHWDNRETAVEVADSVAALAEIAAAGCRIGLSGIRHPHHYRPPLREAGLSPFIQVKHNLLQSDYGRYAAFHGAGRFIAYGINAGGIKLDGQYDATSSLVQRGKQHQRIAFDTDQLRTLGGHADPPLTRFNEWGMLYAHAHPDFCGILLGTSRVAQLESSIAFHRRLMNGELDALYDPLRELAAR